MSTRVIDNEVVNLKFNNADFEKNVSTSLSTLDKLKQALKFDNAAKGLKDVTTSVGRVNFDALNTAIDTINSRFSNMGVVATTVLENMTNAAINTGKQMLESLTIEPISEGFSEYELKMDSVQTIMNGTGADLDTVMDKLNELNTYADKTIYSFSDMTSSIGKFTNAGVDLDTAVKAIQGISNEAALSGANAQQASHAMYNFAQALQTGSVKLIDWKSIENANMATVGFKDELLKTAAAMGTLKDNFDGTYEVLTENGTGSMMDDVISATQNFNDSLQYQWMTSEVLTQTLAKYSDETTQLGHDAMEAATQVKTFSQLMDTLKEAVGSGWAETWEIVFGDFNEAKDLWTSVSNVVGDFIGRVSDARNADLLLWDQMNGRNAIIDGFRYALEDISNIMKPIRDAFREFFPPDMAELLTNFSFKFRSLMYEISLATKDGTDLNNVFRGFFASIKIVYNALHTTAVMLEPLFKVALSGGGKLLKLLATIGKFIADNQSIVSETIDKGIVAIIYNTASAIEKLVTTIGSLMAKLGGLIGNSAVISKIKSELPSIQARIQNFINVLAITPLPVVLDKLHAFSNFLVTLVETIGERLLAIFKTVAMVVGGGILLIAQAILGFDGIEVGSINNFSGKVEKAVSPVTAIFEKLAFAAGKVVEFIKFAYPYVTGFLVKMVDVIGDIAGRVGRYIMTMNSDELMEWIKTGTFVGFFLEFKKMSGAFEGIEKFFSAGAKAFEELGGVLKDYQKSLKADILLKIAEAIGILALSLVALSFIPSEKLGYSIGAIASLFGMLTVSLKLITGSLGGDGIKKAIGQHILIKQLGTFLLEFSGAIAILTGCFMALSQLDASKLQNGFIGIAAIEVLLTAIAGLITILPKSENSLVAVGISMMLIAQSIDKLIGAVAEMIPLFDQIGQINPDNLKRGGLVLAGSLTALTLMAAAIGTSKIGLGSSIGLVGMVYAIKQIVDILLYLGTQDVGVLVKGGLALTVLAAALGRASGFDASSGAGILLMAAALEIVIDVIKKFAEMNIWDIAKGIVAMGGALFVIGKACGSLTTSVGGALALLIIATGIAVLSDALVKFGSLGIWDIGKALLMLAGVLVAFTAASVVMAAFAPALLILAAALVALGAGLTLLAGGILLFTTAMAAVAAMDIAAMIALIPALKKMIEEFCDMVVTLAPSISAAIDAMLDVIFSIVEKYTPRVITYLVETIMNFIIAALTAVRDHISEIVVLVIDIIIGVIEGIIIGIGHIVQSLFDLAFAIVAAFGNALGDPRTADELKEAIKALGRGLIDGFKNFFGINSPSTVFQELAGYLIDGLVLGFVNRVKDLVNVVEDAGRQMVDAIENKIDDFTTAGKNILEGLKNGIKDSETLKHLTDTAKSVFSTVRDVISGVFDENSPSKVTYEFGKFVDIGFANGMEAFTNVAVDAAKGFGNDALSAMKTAIADVTDEVENGMNVDPTIRPVMDLSDVRTGISNLNGMIGSTRTMNLAASANFGMNSILSRNQNGVVVNNVDVVKAISDMRTDFGTMVNAIRELQIVMDTGSLVGAISEPMDRAFGKMAMMNERGI